MLRYLDFDYSEDTEGICTFEAMASTSAAHVAALHAEIAEVLAWAFETFAGQRGPLEDGYEWDFDLQSQQEYTVSESLEFDPETAQINVCSQVPGISRHTVTLSLSGSPTFGDALRDRFDLG